MNFSINREDGDKILEEFVVHVSKQNGSKRCAEESYELLKNYADCQLVLSLIMRNSFMEQGMIPNHIQDFEAGILSALTSMFCCCEPKDIPKPLQPFFENAKNDDEIFERVSDSQKLIYAVSHFVSAYLHYDYFQSKYPELSKAL